MPFEDNVLLKLKRRYKENEAFLFIIQELQKAEFKNGEFISENSELKHENHLLRMENQVLKKAVKPAAPEKPKITKEDLLEARFIEVNKKLTAKGVKIKKLEDDVNLWRSKWLNLTAHLCNAAQESDTTKAK